jgi:hypothetical protein
MSLGTHVRIIVVVFALLAAADVSAAQDRPVRVEGRVAWVSGQTLVLAPDGSPSINVDLSQVPQEQHSRLREGDRIVVTGAVPNERNRLIAAAIERLGP